MGSEHSTVQRVAVVRQRARYETVVGGIVRGGVEHAVEYEHARGLVQLVLLFLSLGDLYVRDKIARRDARRIDIMPDIHSFSPIIAFYVL